MAKVKTTKKKLDELISKFKFIETDERVLADIRKRFFKKLLSVGVDRGQAHLIVYGIVNRRAALKRLKDCISVG